MTLDSMINIIEVTSSTIKHWALIFNTRFIHWINRTCINIRENFIIGPHSLTWNIRVFKSVRHLWPIWHRFYNIFIMIWKSISFLLLLFYWNVQKFISIAFSHLHVSNLLNTVEVYLIDILYFFGSSSLVSS